MSNSYSPKDTCVVCGTYIPEGSHVCSECLKLDPSAGMSTFEAIRLIEDHIRVHRIGQYPHIGYRLLWVWLFRHSERKVVTMPKITRKMLEEARHERYSVVGHFQAFCKLNSCCENCDRYVRLLCKVKSRIQRIQEKRILKICKDDNNEKM